MAELLGYSVDELLQTEIKDIVHSKDLERVSRRHRRRMAGESSPHQDDTLLLTEHRAALPPSLTASRTGWMGQPATVVFFGDITAKKRAEAQMQRLSWIIEQAGDAVAEGVDTEQQLHSPFVLRSPRVPATAGRPARLWYNLLQPARL